MFKNGMRPAHPGEILLEDGIKPVGIRLRAVALALHVPCSRPKSASRAISSDVTPLAMTA